MKAKCRAAGFALIGWYLMVPPVGGLSKSDERRAESAPLSSWVTLGQFDTKESCEQEATRSHATGAQQVNGSEAELQKRFGGVVAGKRPLMSIERLRMWGTGLMHAECVATNDRRLQKK